MPEDQDINRSLFIVYYCLQKVVVLFVINVLEGILYPIFTLLRTGEYKKTNETIKRNRLAHTQVVRSGTTGTVPLQVAATQLSSHSSRIYTGVDRNKRKMTASTTREH